jgi:hypothetical protein
MKTLQKIDGVVELTEFELSRLEGGCESRLAHYIVCAGHEIGNFFSGLGRCFAAGFKSGVSQFSLKH